MKKNTITLLVVLMSSIFSILGQEQITKELVAKHTAKLTPEANWKKIERSGDFPGMVDLAKDILDDGQWSNVPGYSVTVPSQGDSVDWIEMDLSSLANRSYKGGTFLDNGKLEHFIITHLPSGFQAPAGCLNGIKQRVTYRFETKPIVAVQKILPTTQHSHETVIVDSPCNPCEKKSQYNATLSEESSIKYKSLESLSEQDLVSYNPSPFIQKNEVEKINLDQFKIKTKTESKFWRTIKPYVVGTAAAIGTYVLADGISDGQWFEWTKQPFTRPSDNEVLPGKPNLDPSATTFNISVQNTQFGTAFGAGITIGF